MAEVWSLNSRFWIGDRSFNLGSEVTVYACHLRLRVENKLHIGCSKLGFEFRGLASRT